MVGMEALWPLKDLSLDDEVTTTRLKQCCVTMDNCINWGRNKFHARMRLFLKSVLRMSVKLRNGEICEIFL
jgi:hypothetical protein